jgi:hypothetical protein
MSRRAATGHEVALFVDPEANFGLRRTEVAS